jgi:hypothetical protein
MGILGCKARRLTIRIDHTVVMLTLAIGVRVLVFRPPKCGEAPGRPLRPRIGLEGHHNSDQPVAETAPVDNP